MFDTSEYCYAEQRETVFRVKRTPDTIDRIISDPSISAWAASLLIWMLGRPVRWRFLVSHIVSIRNSDGKSRWGCRDKVRRLLTELCEAGYVTVERQGREGGGFEKGIYLVSDQKRWLTPVDISEGEKTAETGQLGASQTETKAPCFAALRIDNSIRDPEDTTCAEPVEIAQIPDPTEAETGQGRSKTRLTEQSEPQQAAAKGHSTQGSPCEPRNERRSRAANGSPVKERAEKSSDKRGHVRIAEQSRAQLIAAGGTALSDPRRTPGLTDLQVIIAWLQAGFDMARDIIPTILAISGRATMRPGQVRSWKYYDAAICAAHAERMGLERPRAAPKRGPRLDPYAPPPPDPDDGSAWQQVLFAVNIARKKRGNKNE
jgi:hypothetical protein